MIVVRQYQSGDEHELRSLFFHTVREVNRKDYSRQQVHAWAPENYDQAQWRQRIQAIQPFIATINEKIVGYADVQIDGYIDHFYCHWQHQGQGVGKALMTALLHRANQLELSRLYAQASITAKPFFAHYGFTEVSEQQVDICGVTLTNYVMEKWL